jgi:hypothetical protein
LAHAVAAELLVVEIYGVALKNQGINEEEFFGFARVLSVRGVSESAAGRLSSGFRPDEHGRASVRGSAHTRQPASHLVFPLPQPLRGNSGGPEEASESRIASHRDLNFWIKPTIQTELIPTQFCVL